jgi:hypothetical protein
MNINEWIKSTICANTNLNLCSKLVICYFSHLSVIVTKPAEIGGPISTPHVVKTLTAPASGQSLYANSDMSTPANCRSLHASDTVLGSLVYRLFTHLLLPYQGIYPLHSVTIARPGLVR